MFYRIQNTSLKRNVRLWAEVERGEDHEQKWEKKQMEKKWMRESYSSEKLAGNRISVYLNINYKLYICIVPYSSIAALIN